MIRSKIVAAVASCSVALAMVGTLSRAQEEKKGTETKSAEKGKVKGKLPLYFGQIGLSKKQEDDVRKAGQPFDEKIAELRQKVAELEKQIDQQDSAKLAACEKLLSENQKSVLKERRETAEKEAAARKKAGKKADGDEKKSEEKKPAAN